MSVYQGELKDGRGRWLATVCVMADSEKVAASKLGISSASFQKNFSLNDKDHDALRVCGRSICGIAEGVANFRLTVGGKEGCVSWVAVDYYRQFLDRSIEKAKERESWG